MDAIDMHPFWILQINLKIKSSSSSPHLANHQTERKNGPIHNHDEFFHPLWHWTTLGPLSQQ
eukprot:scaffold19418_cov39-Attheya_sp.AAC.1